MEEDIELVNKCLLKDTDAFEKLIDRYQKPIYNFGMRMFGNSDDAEELTQVVFIKTWERLESYNSQFKFFSWIYRIAVNESLNISKREKNKDRLESDNEYKSSSSIESEFDRDEQVKKIHEALTEIDVNYRIVIILRHYMDLSYQEIAKLIGIPEKTVKSRLFSARNMMKEILLKKELF